MPYIVKHKRDKFKRLIKDISELVGGYAELTYVLYAITMKYYNSMSVHNWAMRSSILKCLHAVHHEFELNHIDIYEAQKKLENGDIK